MNWEQVKDALDYYLNLPNGMLYLETSSETHTVTFIPDINWDAVNKRWVRAIGIENIPLANTNNE